MTGHALCIGRVASKVAPPEEPPTAALRFCKVGRIPARDSALQEATWVLADVDANLFAHIKAASLFDAVMHP